MYACNILKYVIVFSISKLALTCATEFCVGKFIVYYIGIFTATLIILNMALSLFVFIAKSLILDGHEIVRPASLKLLFYSYFITSCILLFFITALNKLVLSTAALAFRPVKLMDAMTGCHNYNDIMTSIKLMNLHVEIALVETAHRVAVAHRIELRFLDELRRIRLMQSVDSIIPRLRYGALGEEEKKNGECVFCLESFGEEDSVRVARECKHCYHVKCIDEWLIDHKDCPICRADILPSEKAHRG